MKRYSKIIVILLVLSTIIPNRVQAEATNVKRLYGKTRIETAIEVSKEVYPNGAESVVLAGYKGEVDALTGTLLAANNDAPLLITLKDKVHPDLKSELKRLKSKTIYIVGGEAAIQKSVETELEKDYKVIRISGSSREETAVSIAKEVNSQTKNVFLAKGYNVLADALAIGPVSATKDIPVLLTQTNKLSQTTIDAMKELGVTNVTIVGGEKAISKTVENQLKAYKVDRIEGSNREKTALAIASKYFTNSKNAIIANGYVYADALVGGYLGAKENTPILLTRAHRLDTNNIKYLDTNTDFVYIMGGNTMINEKIFTTIESILNGQYVEPKPEPEKPVYNPKSIKIETRGLVFNTGKSSDQIRLLKDFFRARKTVNVSSGYSYDDRTKQLVRDYQKSKGLGVDGIAGKLTLVEMNKEIRAKNYKIGLYIPHINNKGDIIIINKSSNTLYFIRNGVIQESYPIATGKTESLTPNGKFKIVVKFKNPSWGGAGTSKPIAGGLPNNPLGTRWIGISYGGGGEYGVHGNSNPSSIGTYASLGCVRMFNGDVEKLYEKVKISTPIWIGSEKQLESFGVRFKSNYKDINTQAEINIISNEKELNVKKGITNDNNLEYYSFYEISKIINGNIIKDEEITKNMDVLGGYDVEFLSNDH